MDARISRASSELNADRLADYIAVSGSPEHRNNDAALPLDYRSTIVERRPMTGSRVRSRGGQFASLRMSVPIRHSVPLSSIMRVRDAAKPSQET